MPIENKVRGKKLIETNPELIMQFHPTKNQGILISDLSSTSKKQIWWKCNICGKEWKVAAYHRYYGSGCPVCSRKKTRPGENDFATACPDLLKEWDYKLNKKQPNEISPLANYKAHWICKKGHKWTQLVSSRNYRKSKCPYCLGRKVVRGETDFMSTHPELIMEWDWEKNKVNPEEITEKCKKQIVWKCLKGHTWETTVYHRVKNKTRCPYCAEKRAIPGENDFASNYPELIKEWDWKKNRDDPSLIGCSNINNYAWICSKGHSWRTSITHRVHANSGCPYCAGQKPIIGQTDLRTTNPDLIDEWNYKKNRKTPEKYMKNSGAKVWWTCRECGHDWRAEIIKRSYGTGCPKCARKIIK